jgi:hypothetical protein
LITWITPLTAFAAVGATLLPVNGEGHKSVTTPINSSCRGSRPADSSSPAADRARDLSLPAR